MQHKPGNATFASIYFNCAFKDTVSHDTKEMGDTYREISSQSLGSRSPVDGVSPDSKVHGTNMGPIWGQQDPGGPHVGPMNFAIWVPYVYKMEINTTST